MVSDWAFYRLYLSVKAHFTKPDFDVFVHNFTRTSKDTFLKRPDVPIFGKYGDKMKNNREAIKFLVSNFSVGNMNLLYNQEEAFDNFNCWVAYNGNITYNFKRDFSNVENYMERYSQKFHAAAWKCYLGGKINIQSLFIMDDFSEAFRHIDGTFLLLSEKEILRVRKCKGFVKVPATIRDFLETKTEVVYG